MKAMNLMEQCYNMRIIIIDSGVFIKEFFDYTDEVERAKKDIGRREKIKAFLEGRKLT
jgi:hypothetical protein